MSLKLTTILVIELSACQPLGFFLRIVRRITVAIEMNNKHAWLKWVHQLQAMSQEGLTYCKDPFCAERYKALLKLTSEIVEKHSEHEQEKILEVFAREVGYQTPKLDSRGVIFKDNKVLLVQESADNLWSLPGGWSDVNESPSEAVVREVREESGYIVKAVRLLALYDKQKHDYPPQFPHVYKSFFLCEIEGGKPQTSHEILAVDFFEMDKLPPLSLHRITESQLKRLFELYSHPEWITDFD